MAKTKVVQVEKSWLQKFRESESSASVIFGAIVVVVVGILLFNYSKSNTSSLISEEGGSTESASISSPMGIQLPTNHVVAKGENLWAIAAKYYGDGNKWQDLIEVNSLNTSGDVEVGQTLTIPSLVSVEAPPAQAEKTYTVKAGDCLWDIAVASYGDGYKWTQIYEANKKLVADPNLIYTGQVIAIP